jgi:hypothetical protein
VLHIEIPEGFEEFYAEDEVLLLLVPIYGLRQAAMSYYAEANDGFKDMGYHRSTVDPCLFFKWTMFGLTLFTIWVDDNLAAARKEGLQFVKNSFMSRFDVDDVGNMDEYVGCKIERGENEKGPYFKLTQPVLLQSLTDELAIQQKKWATPAEPGTVLSKATRGTELEVKKQKRYRTGVGKLLHIMKHSRFDVMNATRECSKHMMVADEVHEKALNRLMEYLVFTKERGLYLQPNTQWDGDPEFEFTICGKSDSDYAKDPDTRRSVSGGIVYLNGAPVSCKCQGQKVVALSVTEAELYAVNMVAQDMLFVKRLLESLQLKVSFPMLLYCDNKGCVDLINNFSCGGRTRHVESRCLALREIKDVVKVVWIKSEDNEADVFTKNLGGPSYEEHTSHFTMK